MCARHRCRFFLGLGGVRKGQVFTFAVLIQSNVKRREIDCSADKDFSAVFYVFAQLV